MLRTVLVRILSSVSLMKFSSPDLNRRMLVRVKFLSRLVISWRREPHLIRSFESDHLRLLKLRWRNFKIQISHLLFDNFMVEQLTN